MSSQPSGPQSALPSPGAPPALPPGSAPYVRLPKSPGLAAFLSLFPGLGQVYNGQIARAFVFFFAFFGCIYLSATGHELPFAFGIPFAYLWSIVDAWKGASAVNTRFLGGRSEPEELEIESPAWGGSLALFGVLILFNNLGWLDLDRLAPYWPILLIAVGIFLVYRSLQARKAAASSSDQPTSSHGSGDEPPSL